MRLMSSVHPPRTIGITLGDAAGVGPEIVAAALASGKLDARFDYRVIGTSAGVRAGRPGPRSAELAIAALEEAARLARTGEIAAVVTGPIHKARAQAAGFAFPGQSEFFAARWRVKNFAMCLTGGALTVALVTAHIPLAQVAGELRGREIVRVGGLLAEFLRARLGRAVRIAVAGLNPHAGESGALGREEIETVAPAVAKLRTSWGRRAKFDGPI